MSNNDAAKKGQSGRGKNQPADQQDQRKRGSKTPGVHKDSAPIGGA